MRDAVKRLGGNPDKINPICPTDMVIDHSVQVDVSRRLDLNFDAKQAFVNDLSKVWTIFLQKMINPSFK